MSWNVQQLEYNLTGQTVELYPNRWALGVPTSAATYSVWAGSYDLNSTAEFTGTATADSVSTTFDANSGVSSANRKKVNLTATSNIVVDRLYIAETSNGVRELVRPTAIASADYVLATEDLENDFVATNTFKGFRQSFTVDSTFIATESKINSPKLPYKVRWRYAIGGVTYTEWTYFNVQRVIVEHSVIAQDLMEFWPDLWAQEPESQRNRWQRAIDGAYDRVRFDLANFGVDISQVREGDLNELVRSSALHVVAQMGLSQGNLDVNENLRVREQVYNGDLSNLVQRMRVDQGSMGSISLEADQQLFSIR